MGGEGGVIDVTNKGRIKQSYFSKYLTEFFDFNKSSVLPPSMIWKNRFKKHEFH